MIKINNKSISSVYDEKTGIEKIMKGTLKVYESWEKLIASGVPPITLQKCKGVDLVDYKIYGDSVQNGTPTPEIPIEIESVGDKTINLCPGYYNAYPVEGRLDPFRFPVKANTIYSINFNSEINAYKTIWLFDSDGTIYKKPWTYAYGNTGYNKAQVLAEQDGFMSVGILNDEAKVIVAEGQYFTLNSTQQSNFETNGISSVTSGELDYVPYGYEIPVISRGKNLLDKGLSQVGYYGRYIDNEGYDPSGTLWNELPEYTGQIPETYGWYVTNPIPIKPDTDYTYSGLQKANNPAYIFLEEDKSTIIQGGAIKTSATFTTPSNARYIVMSLRSDYIETMMLEVGDAVTEYEPYIEPIKTNIYLKEPLRKIGDDTDYIDFEKQKVFRNIIEKVLNGSESWSIYSSTDGKYYTSVLEEGFKSGSIGLCDKFIWVSGASNDGECYIAGNGTSYHNFFVKEATLFPTKDDLLAFLQENNVKFISILGETDDTETIELPNIPTHKGTTIIEVDTELLPSNMEVKYYGKE